MSARKVDELLQALGLAGLVKGKVSRICRGLDKYVEGFRNRPLEGSHPHVSLDSPYPKVRQGRHTMSRALVVAIRVKETGERAMIGFSLSQPEEYAFWLVSLNRLARRAQLATDNARERLKAAVEQVPAGSTWQCYWVHFMHNVLAHAPKGGQVGRRRGAAHDLSSARLGSGLPAAR